MAKEIEAARHPTVLAGAARQLLYRLLPALGMLARNRKPHPTKDGKYVDDEVPPATQLEVARFLAKIARVDEKDPHAMGLEELRARLADQMVALDEWALGGDIPTDAVNLLKARLAKVWQS